MVRAARPARLVRAGALPRGFNTLGTEDVNTWLQTGRAAMAITSCGRHSIYNDPEKSKEAGNIKTVPMPVGEEFKAQFDVAPAKVEFWTMAIPKTSQHKELAWSLVREMLSKQARSRRRSTATARCAPRPTTRPRSREAALCRGGAGVLKVGRVPLPPFDNAQKAADTFKEDAEAAVLGQKPPQQAMDDLVAKVKPMLPK